MAKSKDIPEKKVKRRKKKADKTETVSKPVQNKTINIPAIKPKSVNQEIYIDAIKKEHVIFGIGPAGTGKTFLACFCAAEMLAKGLVRRILLVRPAVETGEKLGFLPGRLEDKLDPYMRPLYDALNDMIGFDRTKELVKNREIEIVPLAYMRGRTLNNAAVILDEAQNTDVKQMKMFLTRMGNSSVFVINGDTSQTDIEETSGLVDAQSRLKGVEGIKFVYFSASDIVRHPVVQRIVEAYDHK